jgi:hypothetical protein
MNNTNRSPYSKTAIVLTHEGRLALAADALAAAQKTRNETRRQRLCEQTVAYLRPLCLIASSGLRGADINTRRLMGAPIAIPVAQSPVL